MPSVKDAKILIVATDGFEQSELLQPRDDLTKAGATVHVASPKEGEIKAWDKDHWGETVKVDLQVAQANADDYDAIVLPGGQINPDKLRAGKPIAAICHAPWLLIEAGLAGKDRTLTSYESIRTDVRNAGATWVDQEVVTDGNVITSRNPGDLDAFGRAVIEMVGKKMEERAAA